MGHKKSSRGIARIGTMVLNEPEGLGEIVAAAVTSGIGEPPPMAPVLRLTARLDKQSQSLGWSLEKWEKRLDPPIEDFVRVLPEFIALADGSNEAILRFAQRYGPLGLCREHSKPLYHAPQCISPNSNFIEIPEINPDERVNREWIERIKFFEALSGWRLWAGYIRAVVHLGSALRQGGPGKSADWRFVLNGDLPPPKVDRMHLLASLANDILRLTQPVPMVALDDAGNLALKFVNAGSIQNRSAVEVAKRAIQSTVSGALLAAIAVAAASWIAGGRALSRCTGCGTSYHPKREPGERHFCAACGSRASWRLSKQRQRAKS
jgi:hypothetical protein